MHTGETHDNQQGGKRTKTGVKTKHMREEQDYKIKQEMMNKTPNHESGDMIKGFF